MSLTYVRPCDRPYESKLAVANGTQTMHSREPTQFCHLRMLVNVPTIMMASVRCTTIVLSFVVPGLKAEKLTLRALQLANAHASLQRNR